MIVNILSSHSSKAVLEAKPFGVSSGIVVEVVTASLKLLAEVLELENLRRERVVAAIRPEPRLHLEILLSRSEHDLGSLPWL